MRQLLLLLALLASPTVAQPLTGNIAIHDPSIAVLDGGFVSFATGVEGASDGGTVRTKSSPNGIDWHETGALPGGLPEWISSELGYAPKNLWAPSVSEHAGTRYLYYSASSFGKNDSAIGLMTNAALDPAKPSEGWSDQGLVIRSHADDNYNAIDPFRIDTSSKAYLAFGSFWDGIRLVELDPATGKPRPDAEILPIASRGGGAIEAPAILEHQGRFYLFVSFDRCCSGLASTYRIMVGRADAIAGPYLDAAGQPMLEGGGTELLKSTGRYRGPGGQEVFLRDGEPWLVFHYYDRDQGGVPKLYLTPLQWNTAGWPSIAPLE
jgi:arabinan endo-1,5-alpha-L-arabinosidase